MNEANVSGTSKNNEGVKSTGFKNNGNFASVNTSVVGTSIVQNNYSQNPNKANPSTLHEFTAPCREFTGRVKERDQIKKALSSWYDDGDREYSVDRTFIIQGYGGMGKSNLAFKFARLNTEVYDCIFQIGAQTKETMMAGFRKFAQRLKIELPGEQIHITEDDIDLILRKAAEVYERVLIIFDNAERLHTTSETFGIFNYLANDAFIPNKPVFLVTTRNGGEAWEAHGEKTDSVPPSQRLPIDFLGEGETYACLLVQFRLEDTKSEIEPELTNCIRELSTLIGGYPLSMSLIAGVIARKVRAEAFREDLETKIKYYIKLLSPDKIQEHEGDQNHQKKLSLVFNETLKQIRLEEDGNMAEQLLGMIAYLQPAASYVEFLNSVITKTEYNIWDSDKPVVKCDELSPAVKRGLKVLKEFSIISVYEERRKSYDYIPLVHDKISVHRLVQAQAEKVVALKLITFKNFVEFIELASFEHTTFLHEIAYLEDFVLQHDEPKEVAHQILVVFWLIVLLQNDYFCEKQKLFLSRLKTVSEHLGEDDKLMLQLGELYVKNKKPDESITDPRPDSRRIAGLVPKLGQEFCRKLWVLIACCQTMLKVYDHPRPLQKYYEYWEGGMGCRTSFANWLYDQIIFLNETTTLAPWLQKEVLDIFCRYEYVHIESSKFIHVLKILTPHITEFPIVILLCQYIQTFVTNIPSLSCDQKIDLLLVVSDLLPVKDDGETLTIEFRRRRDWQIIGVMMEVINECLEELFSLDGFTAAASNNKCERLTPRFECLLREYCHKVNDEATMGMDTYTRREMIASSPSFIDNWVALWSHREASEENVAHINKFFSTLPDVMGSSFFKLDIPRWISGKSSKGVSDFIQKFQGKPNLNKKLMETAERLLKSYLRNGSN